MNRNVIIGIIIYRIIITSNNKITEYLSIMIFNIIDNY